jgi:hypothetical protein
VSSWAIWPNNRSGKAKILVVEDEPLEVMDMEGILEALGASMAGPAASVVEAHVADALNRHILKSPKSP